MLNSDAQNFNVEPFPNSYIYVSDDGEPTREGDRASHEAQKSASPF